MGLGVKVGVGRVSQRGKQVQLKMIMRIDKTRQGQVTGQIEVLFAPATRQSSAPLKNFSSPDTQVTLPVLTFGIAAEIFQKEFHPKSITRTGS